MTTALDEVFDYGWYAETYRWPPTVVDEQPWWFVAHQPTFARAWAEVKAAAEKKAMDDAEREAERRRR